MQHHKYSLTELDGLIPWEYDIYIALLKNYLEEEKQRIEQQKHSQMKSKQLGLTEYNDAIFQSMVQILLQI